MREPAIEDRIRSNIEALIHSGRKKVKQRTIANALGLSYGQISSFLAGRTGIALKHLDPLAQVLGTVAAELVRSPSKPLYELTGVEARVVQYFRQWSPDVQQAWLTVLDFLHARLPDDPLTVRMFDYWGRLESHERVLLFESMLRQRAERLRPSERAELGIPEDTASPRNTTGKRMRGKP